jgi:hypothetical protein
MAELWKIDESDGKVRVFPGLALAGPKWHCPRRFPGAAPCPPAWRCRSSVVEHVLGKDGVGSSILLGSTTFNQRWMSMRTRGAAGALPAHRPERHYPLRRAPGRCAGGSIAGNASAGCPSECGSRNGLEDGQVPRASPIDRSDAAASASPIWRMPRHLFIHTLDAMFTLHDKSRKCYEAVLLLRARSRGPR